ncbi:hypothetical protein [Solilutibacter silvestris]|uniref:Uncharacterized protein n=1 Tax=Solilutibacter silvestris TaxID=1645665 RepID=A0A2K1PZE7_9GAMM|nr:hypothetical protein [Lysobacter silvestris]PNS08172.1 hypothetical protein Lysil_2348 [Lysobacter silvestris]
MNIGATARRHGTTALLSLAIAGFGTATALAGSPVAQAVAPVAAVKAHPTSGKASRIVRIRQAQAVPFFAFPPRI